MSSGLDFVALDVETANARRGSVCAIGLAVVRAGQVQHTHSWLTRPPAPLDWFDPFNTFLHGIAAEHVAAAPSFSSRLGQVLEVVGDLPVIAHNAAFDTGALRDACDAESRAWPQLDYWCSLMMARRALDLVSYRLPLVAAALGVPLTDHHDAGADATAAAHVVLALAQRRGTDCVQALGADLRVGVGRLSADAWAGCRAHSSTHRSSTNLVPPAAALQADPDHPLYGQVIVFTGALATRREDAWAAVAALGATPDKTVTARTTLLVIGDGFTGDDPAAFTTGKAAKAAALRAKGKAIEVLTEADLIALTCERSTAGRRTGADER